MNRLTYEALSNLTFVFTGCRATTGTPNRTTGKMSNFGEYHAFLNKESAKEFARTCNDSVVHIGTARTLRKYSAGQTVTSYIEHLSMLEVTW